MSYPLTYPDNGDPRFTGELIDEIAAVLTAHDYPSASSDDTDFARLRDALRSFLYGPEFNVGDKVAWYRKNKVWSGRIEYVANTDKGPVARIRPEKQPGSLGIPVTAVVPCRDLTQVRDGAS